MAIFARFFSVFTLFRSREADLAYFGFLLGVFVGSEFEGVFGGLVELGKVLEEDDFGIFFVYRKYNLLF